jgi:hypothetical protein
MLSKRPLCVITCSILVLATLTVDAREDDNYRDEASDAGRHGRSVVVVDHHGILVGAWAFNYQQVTSLSGELVLEADDEVVYVPLAPTDSTGRAGQPEDLSTTGTVLYHQAVDCADARLTPQTGLVLAPVPANDWAGILFFPDNSATPVSSGLITAKEVLAPGQDFNQPGACVPVSPGTVPTSLPVKTYSIKRLALPFTLQVR